MVSVQPADGSQGIATTAGVTATSSEEMAADTVTGATFILKKGDAAINAAVGYDAATKTATLDPASDTRRPAQPTRRR